MGPTGRMTDFVDENSIAREIWGNSDMILLVFTGAAAGFALNRAADWLFFTNRPPPEYLKSIRRFDRPRDRHAEPGLSIGIEN